MYGLEAIPRPLIFGCAGLVLHSEERELFADVNPYGFILFDRNINNPSQVRLLVNELRSAVRRPDAPVLVDQEGGRVARLGPPYWRQPPAAAELVSQLGNNIEKACQAIFINSQIIAHELSELHITVDCMPVLDLATTVGHQVIGERAYGEVPARVAEFGRAACSGLLNGGVLPVIKHIPGHGRAASDSHVSLPFVQAKWEDLAQTDFLPFRALSDMPMAMTAHVVFTAIDPKRPATTSPLVVADVIRGEIGFEGLLMTDDICMSALEGSPIERAEAALAAGCDVVLHCNGQLNEMIEIADGVGAMAKLSWERAMRAAGYQDERVSPIDLAAAKQELARLLA